MFLLFQHNSGARVLVECNTRLALCLQLPVNCEQVRRNDSWCMLHQPPSSGMPLVWSCTSRSKLEHDLHSWQVQWCMCTDTGLLHCPATKSVAQTCLLNHTLLHHWWRAKALCRLYASLDWEEIKKRILKRSSMCGFGMLHCSERR